MKTHVTDHVIRLRSGRYLDLVDPQPDQFVLKDIASGLSKQCRFSGQCQWFYSIAEHSIHCGVCAQEDGHDVAIQRKVFAHDFAEAFVHDLSRPLKRLVPEYKAVESRLMKVIAQKYSLDYTSDWPIVRQIDWEMLIAERHHLFSVDQMLWSGEDTVRRRQIYFKCFDHFTAEKVFLDLCNDLDIKD